MFDASSIPQDMLHSAVKEVLSGQMLSGGGGSSPYNFRCPICGDSKKNKHLKRGYVLHARGDWVYVCHNECGSMSFLTFLKNYHQDVYKKVIIHGFSQGSSGRPKIDMSKTNDSGYVALEDATTLFKPNELISIYDHHPLAEAALAWVKYRRIRKMVYDYWYVCLEGEEFLDRDKFGNLVYNENGFPKGNEYKNRLIIPYYHFGGKWSQFDARSLEENPVIRYKNIKNVEKEPYNIDWLDVTKPFFLLEGSINSTFIKNAVSFGGTSHFETFLEKYPHILQHAHNGVVIWDNDDAGKDKLPTSIKLGFKWFNWSLVTPSEKYKYNKDGSIRVLNDINDLVMYSELLEFDEIEYIKYESLLPFIEDSCGGLVKATLLYGDREAMRREKQRTIFNQMNENRRNKEKIKFNWD